MVHSLENVVYYSNKSTGRLIPLLCWQGNDRAKQLAWRHPKVTKCAYWEFKKSLINHISPIVTGEKKRA